jgi:hypothetical protein
MGSSSIELFEWNRQDVMKKRLPNKPAWASLANQSGSLPLTGMRLAHAVVKADFLIARNYVLPSVGFLLQMDQIIDFGSSANLRLLRGASSILNDVSQTSLTGRVGQGLSLLFAESRGYDFVGHLGSDASVLAHLAALGRRRAADFMFEDSTGDRMILESKATFSLQTNECSSVKTVLRQALKEQVDPWMGVVTPSPSKGFAVYSCLRETDNVTPSALVFVDPPGQKGSIQVELPSDWVRRQNYAAWLRVMGLRDAAVRLRSASEFSKIEGKPTETRMRIVTVQGRNFAVLRAVERPLSFRGTRFSVGMDVDALRAVSNAIQGSPDALIEYSPLRRDDVVRGAPMSILSDGTIFGLAPLKDFAGTEDFLL